MTKETLIKSAIRLLVNEQVKQGSWGYALEEDSSYEVSWKDVLKWLEQQPKTGHWIHREDMDYLDKNKVMHLHFMCQDCGFIHDFIDGHTAQYKYCPSCGVKMESEDDK